jgi:hypothetical protein
LKVEIMNGIVGGKLRKKHEFWGKKGFEVKM